ncbi:MAG: TrkA family potassium uptake protein [Candidatus Coatesbacteria bacterium]|nr:TrkA family potassium uptake protein [Candidatus Coatesbacteria bacterium]
MGKFVVIGLGSFGEYVARSLMERGNEVLVVDREPGRIQRLRDAVSSAMTADAADADFLREADIVDVDAAIVGFSEADMAASILTTMHLKELGIKRIVVKATSNDHKVILEKVGATETVFPERDAAERLASSISSPNIYNRIPLSEGFGILELDAPAKFVVEHLEDLNMRTAYAAHVLFLRRPAGDLDPSRRSNSGNYQVIFPDKQTPVRPGDILILAGTNEALEKISEMKPSTG